MSTDYDTGDARLDEVFGRLDALESGAIRVRFDEIDPDKTISLFTAERLLTDWRKRNPAQFGYWLAAAQVGVEPSKTAKPARPAAT